MGNVPKETGIIHLWDLPTNRIYIKLKQNHLYHLMLVIHKIFNNSHKMIGKKLNLPYPAISCMEHRDGANPLEWYIKIYNLLYDEGFKEFNLSNLEKQVLYIKPAATSIYLYKPKLPFNFNSPEGGRILSAALHDGSLTDERFVYTNRSAKLKKLIYLSIRKIFGDIKAKANFSCIKFSKLVYFALLALGMKEGNKVYTNPSYPDFVFSSPKTWKTIVDQAISDEGWIHGRSLKIVITVNNANSHKYRLLSNILEGDKKIFNLLGVDVNGPRPWKRYKLNIKGKNCIREQSYIEVSKQRNLCKLAKIGISHEAKMNKLISYVNSFKQEQYEPGTNIYHALGACKYLYKKNKEITHNNIARLIHRHPYIAGKLLKKLLDFGWVLFNLAYKEGRGYKHRYKIYQITSKGWDIK